MDKKIGFASSGRNEREVTGRGIWGAFICIVCISPIGGFRVREK